MEHDYLKNLILQTLLSVSIFSFVYPYLSLFPSPIVYSQKLHYYLSSNYWQLLLSHAMNKNCVFLICNGLLVVLAKTSTFVRPPSAGLELNDVVVSRKRIDDRLQTSPGREAQLPLLRESGESDEEEGEECDEEFECSCESPKVPLETSDERLAWWQVCNYDETNKLQNGSRERPEEVSIFVGDGDVEGGTSGDLEEVDNDSVESENCLLFDDQDADEDEDEDEQELHGEEEGGDEMDRLSTEEINQKFDDFIRRMKEEIRINEARQLVMVM